MRATVEHHGSDAIDLPRVEVLIGKGQEDLTIQVMRYCDKTSKYICVQGKNL